MVYFAMKDGVGENAPGGFKKTIPLTSHFNENSNCYALWCRIFHSGGNFPTRLSVKFGLISNGELSRLRLQRQGLSIVPGHYTYNQTGINSGLLRFNSE